VPKKILCDLPGHAGEWIERVDKVTIKQYNEWRRADYETTQKMFSELLVGWNLKNVDGSTAPQPCAAIQENQLAIIQVVDLRRKREQELKDLDTSDSPPAQKISTRSIAVLYYENLIAEAQRQELAARLSPLDNLELALLPWIVEAVRKSLSEDFQLSPLPLSPSPTQ